MCHRNTSSRVGVNSVAAALLEKVENIATVYFKNTPRTAGGEKVQGSLDPGPVEGFAFPSTRNAGS